MSGKRGRKRIRDYTAENFKARYGITVEEYNEKSAAQEHRCAICGSRCVTGRRLAVDHCHVTGAIRGLLCANCNTGLGKFKDDPWILKAAIDYLGGL